LHEDEDLVVISKPPGMVTHPSSIVRGETLSEWAVERYGALPTVQGEDRPGIVHRLDADTTGLVVLARRQAAAEALLAAFKARTVEKTYLALVHNVPRFDSDWIETPIGRSAKRSDRMSTVPEGEGMQAETFYLMRQRFSGGALLEVRPRTGRTHQIRVHLSSIDHPLIGDQVYRGRRGLHLARLPGAPRFERHALHAWKLAFAHPHGGAPLAFEAKLPPDFEAFLAWARVRAEKGAG
jgi:23S rRNA pseudouridine1911/1915/1917 synthase